MRTPGGRPGRRIWLPVLLIVAFLLLNAGGFWYYRRTEASLVATVGSRLLVSTELVSAQIDPGRLLAAADSLFDPDAYIDLDTTLAQARARGNFASIMVLDLDGGDWLAEPDAAATLDAGTLVPAAGVAFDAAAAGIPSLSNLYRSRGDYFLAACVPIWDGDAGVIAVLAAEAGNDYFAALEELSTGLVLLDGFAALLFVGVGVIWYGVQRRLGRAEQAAMRSAQLAAMGRMVATVAHELKNPLGIIRNSAERIRKKYGREDEPLLDFIPEEVDRMDALLRRYLQFARLEVGPTERVELESLAQKLQTNLPESGSTAPLDLRVPGNLAVRADPAALRQILLNLLLNAIEACRGRDGAGITISAVPDGHNVAIAVSDNGTGMDRETLRRAAEPFFTTRSDGSGLGIYLARTLTEQMSGSMSIKSRPGAGTTVTVTLPADT